MDIAGVSSRSPLHANEDVWGSTDIGDDLTLVWVGDGHGAHRNPTTSCAAYVHAHLADCVRDRMATSEGRMTPALRASFADLESGWRERAAPDWDGRVETLEDIVDASGVCLTAALVDRRSSRAVIAHVGDCRAIVINDSECRAITADHRPSHPDERARLEELGISADTDRLHGLGPSRTLGDLDCKYDGAVSSVPDVNTVVLGTDTLLLATDGVWDVVDNDAAACLCRERTPAVAATAIESACRGLSDDDITVVVARF